MDSPVTTPKSVIPPKRSLDLPADSAQSSSESDNQISQKTVGACSGRDCGRKICGLGIRGLLWGGDLGRF